MKKAFLFFFGAVFYTANVLCAESVPLSRTNPTYNVNENIENVDVARGARKQTVVESKQVRTNSRNVNSAKSSKKVASGVASRSTSNQKTNARNTSDNVNVVSRSVSGQNTTPTRRANVVSRVATSAMVSERKKQMEEQNRNVQSRASVISSNKKQVTPTAESISAAKDILEKTADLNNTCQQQYNECMDQFCMVVDANQKRCSCSANLAKYEKVQKAVEEANAELNEVAQNIRYVGLSANEIRAIMSATEAEEAMSKTKDNTQTRSMLDDIMDMIKDPTSSSSDYSVDSTAIMDLDFSSDSSDMFSLDLFNNNSNDISNKRGKDLYKEATKRCKSVLNACKDAGGTESQITGNYDLAIDKDCIAYEQGLEKLNETLVSNVRSANLMLQKARLAVLQNKNQYDIKGCIGALEECMLDDMVCGEDYVKCLDPTKMYIDENGSVVLGRNITNITAFMQNYNNANIDDGFIKGSGTDTMCNDGDGKCIVNYLMAKIGTGATVQDGGLCRAVLDKCQDYTYTKNAKSTIYNPYNDVVVNYVKRAMVNIKAAQARVISNYAQTCMSQIADCYNQQYTQINSWTTSVSANNVYNVLTGACYNVALTCGYAVFAYDQNMGEKVEQIKNNGTENGESETVIKSKQNAALIEGISALFYQSLLCPDNSFYTSATKDSENISRFVNDRCVCSNGYKVSGSACIVCKSGEVCENPESVHESSYGSSSNSGSQESSNQSSPVATCPTNAVAESVPSSIETADRAKNGYVNANCKCNSGYKVYQHTCVSSCPGNSYEYGESCVLSCPTGSYLYNYSCVDSCPGHTEPNNGACECSENYYGNTCSVYCDGYYINGTCHSEVKNNTGTVQNNQCTGFECYGYKGYGYAGNYECSDQCLELSDGKWTVHYASNVYSGSSFCSTSVTTKEGNNTGPYCFCKLDGQNYWVLNTYEMPDNATCKKYCANNCAATLYSHSGISGDRSFEQYFKSLYGE